MLHSDGIFGVRRGPRRRLPRGGAGCTMDLPMKLSVRPLLLALSLTTGRLLAQLTSPSPLVEAPVTAQNAPGRWIVAEGQATQALQTGFPATAVVGFRELLRDPALPPETRQRVTLALVTAQLDAGDTVAAESTLQGYTGPRNSAYQLRAGLIAAKARRIGQVKGVLTASKVEDLPAVDKSWWYYLQALVAE